ncbi:MAG: hypothetical protein RL657_2637, partial [Pseudomonadota bacterium]
MTRIASLLLALMLVSGWEWGAHSFEWSALVLPAPS